MKTKKISKVQTLKIFQMKIYKKKKSSKFTSFLFSSLVPNYAISLLVMGTCICTKVMSKLSFGKQIENFKQHEFWVTIVLF